MTTTSTSEPTLRKLQINTLGSWRDVLTFATEHEPLVRLNAASLLRLTAGKASMRIADAHNTALAYCAGPSFQWRNAR